MGGFNQCESLKHKQTMEFKMKSVIALVLFAASFASATSIKMYDKWSCNFDYPRGQMIRGVSVNVNYDLSKDQGSLVAIANCLNCFIKPLQVSVTRRLSQNTVFFANVKNNVDLRIFWSPSVRPQAPLAASYNGTAGTCIAVN
jgi:hypothetical protein